MERFEFLKGEKSWPPPTLFIFSRNQHYFDIYRCIERYFEAIVRLYDEYFSRQYGFWRLYVEQVIYGFLD